MPPVVQFRGATSVARRNRPAPCRRALALVFAPAESANDLASGLGMPVTS